MPDPFSAWSLPLLYCLGLLAAFGPTQNQWQVARTTAGLALLATMIAVVGSAIGAQFYPSERDRLALTLALLVALLGWVIVNYAARYLQGEPEQTRFIRAMLFTIACVSLLVVSRHLAVIVLAWSGTSVGLHFLLTYYRERKAAQIVAHKKFIASRLADLCLLVALVLVWSSAGTLTLDGLAAHLGSTPGLSAAMHWAAALFALAAILRSAQLPLHGWLIQVMEAPTPVSALLHAGVVNIGGFVLIRLSDLVSAAPVAQAMLVIAGSLTALLAGLVMMTRISIKVRLAWSTCAQMGFMLMEVGLGMYELALLHLVAHSLYKAYAFLNAGETVAESRSNDFVTPVQKRRSLLWYPTALIASAALVAGSASAWQYLVPGFHLPLAASLIVALGLAPLLWFEQDASPVQIARGVLGVIGLSQLYALWHLLFADLAPAAVAGAGWMVTWAVASIGLLYGLQVWLRLYPQGRVSSALYPWAYCGFYLDETFTRLTFRLWPARLQPLRASSPGNPHPTELGEMP
ncbi:NADH-quinone oxidoreductase subunit L [Mangrovimicrobium sediminis]|uniref:Probable inorganic carbon transporter subunit DabB n=1 Tax=Mangrovimicrobium sediminis TaxID=2562682 RepID=A0A4Z0M370_9GAMM|nr:NADH-quinone oxidoreductase subunit L [Haliea sp. SAOS-164]TGD73979.1 NADH-quinone oxidoreductase subunit L [Haliea sp. SAOS-164]